MADITKCNGEGCTLKENCYRFTAPDSYWQAYSAFHEDKKPNEPCPSYWPIKTKLEK